MPSHTSRKYALNYGRHKLEESSRQKEPKKPKTSSGKQTRELPSFGEPAVQLPRPVLVAQQVAAQSASAPGDRTAGTVQAIIISWQVA
ncbi:hypothetical protein EVAR_32652_1 [Eumeta japonica]|uniref:Uncharacterized protein n=1 Tax=Eumeta variegata TaxID=151549 RepID=A0A4C1WW55_EUMVA|nr:hypothetical protein EVAR_32652_1 [Eumeta japonica]